MDVANTYYGANFDLQGTFSLRIILQKLSSAGDA